MNNKIMPYFKRLLIVWSIIMILLSYSLKGRASSVWPVPEDMIGIEDNDSIEFWNSNPSPYVVEYHVDDDLSIFPYKLTNTAHKPHTVHILFDTNTSVISRNLIVGVTADAPEQLLALYFDGRRVGEEKIQVWSSYRHITFWLGSIGKGSHRITIMNKASPNPTAADGIMFDFLRLVTPSQDMIKIPEDYSTITEGIREATPGDIVSVAKGIYRENIILKSGLTLIGEDPDETIIDGSGRTVIMGAYQSQIKGFTIRNGGFTVNTDQGIGINVCYDFMHLSNSIILSCAIGSLLSGQDFNFINNTITKNDYCLYIQKLADANAPAPSLKCENNIFSDSNCALYILSEKNNTYGIDPNNIDRVIQEFSFNNVFTKFSSNCNLAGFGKGNMQTEPFFTDPNGGNYHLEPYSRCIDAGAPTSDFSQEPHDNGQRINMGAFGNTLGATRSLDSDQDGVKDYLEGLKDRDGDGQQDWLDSQTSVFRSAAGDKEIFISLENVQNTSLALTKMRAIDTGDPNFAGFNLPKAHILYGFWGFTITGADQGEKITVDIHFPQNLFDILEYYTYHPEQGWKSIPMKEDLSGLKISIELSDGNATDMDNLQNGSISHVGGIGVPSPFHEGLEPTSCFIFVIKPI